MSENKKQHYVPQFYLKNFSQNEKQIFLYHIESKKYFLSPINLTCQEKYFYGKDLDLEKLLSELENKQAAVIKKIIRTRTTSSLTEMEMYDLYSFIMIQFIRTKSSKMLADNFFSYFSENFIKPMLKNDEDLKQKCSQENIDSVKITMPGFHNSSIINAFFMLDLISDLKIYLLVNKTENPWITSDTPVIKNNYFSLNHINLIGYQSPGLQIICPLTDRLLILLVHENAYEIKKSPNSIIEIDNETDVDNLNILQILHCEEILIIHTNTCIPYIERLHKKIESMKIQKKFVGKTIRSTNHSNGQLSQIVGVHAEGVDYKMRFSFMKMNHMYNRKMKRNYYQNFPNHPTAVPIRNKKISDRITQRFEKLFKIIEKMTLDKDYTFDNENWDLS